MDVSRDAKRSAVVEPICFRYDAPNDVALLLHLVTSPKVAVAREPVAENAQDTTPLLPRQVVNFIVEKLCE